MVVFWTDVLRLAWQRHGNEIITVASHGPWSLQDIGMSQKILVGAEPRKLLGQDR